MRATVTSSRVINFFGADPQLSRELPKKLDRVVISSTKDK